MSKIKNQIRKLYASSILGNLSLTGAWVAILASRGFSLVEIGLAKNDGGKILPNFPSLDAAQSAAVKALVQLPIW